MKLFRQMRRPLGAALMGAAFVFATLSGAASAAVDAKVTLSGEQEAPPVKSAGSGSGTITVGDDRKVSGSFTTKGISANSAHIHKGAPGVNGDVIIPLTRSGENSWKVPEGARLTEEQYQAFQSGELYVNLHTKTHPAGEIRGQIKPSSDGLTGSPSARN